MKRIDVEAETDAVLAGLLAQPFVIHRPARPSNPFIFASPHSGRLYPPSFVGASRLSPLFLRRSEDAYVDELFQAAPAFGSPLLTARFPRAYVDVNRAATELDAQMFDAPLPLDVDAPGPRVAAGLGVIPRVVRDGVEIYRSKLDPVDAAERLARLYRPYHEALAGLVDERVRLFGCAVVVDCHSMPSVPAGPAMVFGDCHGTSISPALLRHIERSFEDNGFSTARNTPYAGGYTTHLYARRESGVHAVQIEINRNLYLDEDRIEKAERFADVRTRITAALSQVLRFDSAGLRPQHPLAAE